MADGNYNRNILPYHNYQSGYRAGRAAMRRLALEAFDKWLQENERKTVAITQYRVQKSEKLQEELKKITMKTIYQ